MPDLMSQMPPQMPADPSQQAPMGATTEGGDQPVTDEQMQQLQELASKVEEQYQKFNSMKFMSENKSEAEKIDFLKQAIQMLEDAGIDPNDPDQINKFISDLEDLDPDLAEMFTTAFESLLGEESGQQLPEGETPAGPTPGPDMGEQAPAAPEAPAGPGPGPGAFQNLMGQMGGGQQ